MDYKGINDYEQLYLISENDEDARYIMYQKYKPIVLATAKKIIKKQDNYKIDIEDLIQEGYIGFDRAIRLFRESADVCFYTFATVCIENQIKTYIRKSLAKRHYILNTSYFIDDIDYNKIADVEKTSNTNPDWCLDNASYNDLCINFKNDLSFKDSCIFELRCNGFKYKEISKILDISVSCIDTSIRRIKDRFLIYLK